MPPLPWYKFALSTDQKSDLMISAEQFPWTETDAMFLLLIKRATELRSRSEASDEANSIAY